MQNIAAHNPPSGYPVHWIFDYFPRFTERERQVALLLFDGKKASEIALALNLKSKAVEKSLQSIATSTRMGHHLNRRGIESGAFFRKWGFIRRK